ncbi:UNVERIFIED_ORG: hypothetical protein E4P37_11385 [Bacillus sp. AZ43]
MKKLAKLGVALAVGAGVALTAPSPAMAADVVMRNDTGAHGYCSGNVSMGYFYTIRSDITTATYYDEYQKSTGAWINAGYSYTLSDPQSGNFTMVTNLIGAPVRVRANHYVYTLQGSSCSQA